MVCLGNVLARALPPGGFLTGGPPSQAPEGEPHGAATYGEGGGEDAATGASAFSFRGRQIALLL